MYWLRITKPSDENDYIEFSSLASYPMPRFVLGRRSIIKGSGEIDSSEYTMRFELWYPVDLDTCWTKWDELLERLDGVLADIYLYDVPSGGSPGPGNLKASWLTSNSEYIRSPKLRALNPIQRKGQWATGIRFDLDVLVRESGEFSGSWGVDRKITRKADSKGEKYTFDITASGPTAYDQLTAFKEQYQGITGTNFTVETEVQEIDKDTWKGNYTISDPSGSSGGGTGTPTRITESIRVEGGGRAVSWGLVTGDKDPVEFKGPRRPVKVMITGEVIAAKPEGLIYPNRDALPGHVRDDAYEPEISQTAQGGQVVEYRGRYTQIFELPNKDNLSQLLKFRDLQNLGSSKSMTSGQADQSVGDAAAAAENKQDKQDTAKEQAKAKP